MGARGHLIVAEEVGPNIFDVRCIGCPYEFQGFTWQGQPAAKEMADRHQAAVRTVESNPNWQDHIDAPVIRRELFGYTGPKAHV